MNKLGKHLGEEKKLLSLLAGGDWLSGQLLGEILGLTRAGIWKQIQKLNALGVGITSSRSHGYCIPRGIELLNLDRIASNTYSCPLGFHLFDEITSTNDFLLQHPNCHQQVCVSESQSEGRGRRGRTWVSPYGRFVYFSIGWTFDGGIAVVEGLSLAIGVAISRALGKLGINEIAVKWPNDIYHQGKKLGGVLIDISGDPSGRFNVVVGIGLNVHSAEGVTNDIDQPFKDLEQIVGGMQNISRSDVVCTITDEISLLLSSYPAKGFLTYKDTWLAKAAFLNQAVVIAQGNMQTTGIFETITDKGAIVLKVDSVHREFHGGELSLRSAL